MEFLRNFETMAAYSAATINRPGVSLIDEGFVIKYDPKIFDFNPRYLYSDLTASKNYNPDKTLIGIEVVPSSHTSDKKARFMSVKNMSLEDPENGTLAVGNDSSNPGSGICWGASGDIQGLNNQIAPKPLKADESGNLLWELNDGEVSSNYVRVIPGYFPIDELINAGMSQEEIDAAVGTYPFYPNKYYVKAAGTDIVMPYPFTESGAREELFAQAGTVLADMDGAGNTAKIIAAATNTETTGAISNEYSEGHFPAAMACHRYRGGGLSSWYLPSMGELVYTWVNIYNINTKLAAAGSDVAVGVGDALTGESLGLWLWSSSVNSSSGAWYLYTYGGDMYRDSRNDSDDYGRVRAFLSLAV